MTGKWNNLLNVLLVRGSRRLQYVIQDDVLIPITSEKGRAISPKSSRKWDIELAASTNSGFTLLARGTTAKRDGQHRIFFTNKNGEITHRSDWRLIEQLSDTPLSEYTSNLIEDTDNNRIVDGSEQSAYQIYSDRQAITITNRRGSTFNNDSNRHWDAIAAGEDNDGFAVLIAGTSNRRLGQYRLWFTNSEGRITSRTGWESGDFYQQQGYENIFNVDLDNDGKIGDFTDDYGNTPTTSGLLSIGSTANGSLEEIGDRDWLEVNLIEGSIYNFIVTGDSLSDPYLRFYDNNGQLLEQNDDHDGSLDSAINSYQAKTTGKYFLGVGAYNDADTGNYEVSAIKWEAIIINDGQASILVTGEPEEEGTLSVELESNDPDGNGDLESKIPLWENSTDNGENWSQLGVSQTLAVTSEFAGSLIRASLKYTDGENFTETIFSDSVSIPDLPPETTDDYGNTPTTSGLLYIDSTANGTLEENGDRDWLEVNLKSGSVYSFTVNGNSLSDPYLRFYDSDGQLLEENDDHNGSLDSAITGYQVSTTDKYFLGVGAYNDASTGSYIVSAYEVEVNNPVYSSQDGYGQINIQTAFEQHLGITLAPVADLGGNLWSLDNIHAPEVWNPSGGFSGTTGNGTIVAVVDTGVDLDHEEFSGRIVQGFDFVDNDSVADDGQGHGTHVAGTIAGANDGFGVTGVAYDAQIMPIRVLDNNGNGYTTDVIEGILYAANNNADVINLSLGGGGYSQAMDDAIAYATSLGSVVVMAAGNSGGSSPNYPAAHAINYGLAVGAVDQSGTFANFSNLAGDIILDYVTAPGVNIYSSTPGDNYDSYNGTSMATPHVAGAAALLRGYDLSLTPESIEDLLTGTSGNNNTSSSSSSHDFLTTSGSNSLQIYSGPITSKTFGSLKSEDFSGTWIGRLSSTSKAAGSWDDENIINSYDISCEKLTNNLFAFDFNSQAESHALIADLLNSKQFDYFESDQIWTFA